MQPIHNRSCPCGNRCPKPLQNTKCLTLFTPNILNKIKHSVFKTRDEQRMRQTPPLEAPTPSGEARRARRRAPTSGRELTSSSKGGCRLRANSQQVVSVWQLLSKTSEKYHVFTPIILNNVKHVVFQTRDARRIKPIHNRWCPCDNHRLKPLQNTECLTLFTPIILNKVKHAHLRLRPTGEQPFPYFFASGKKRGPPPPEARMEGSEAGVRWRAFSWTFPTFFSPEAGAPISGREPRLRAGIQDKGCSKNAPDASFGGPYTRHKRTFVAARPAAYAAGLGCERQPPATPNGQARRVASSRRVGSGPIHNRWCPYGNRRPKPMRNTSRTLRERPFDCGVHSDEGGRV